MGRELQPGFCSATPVERARMRAALARPAERCDAPPPRTSDLFHTCNLPEKFEHPHWFNGYGSQVSNQHPFYRTSSNEYGWYPPDPCTVPHEYFPKEQKFTNNLGQFGMYRNYSLNTVKNFTPTEKLSCKL